MAAEPREPGLEQAMALAQDEARALLSLLQGSGELEPAVMRAALARCERGAAALGAVLRELDGLDAPARRALRARIEDLASLSATAGERVRGERERAQSELARARAALTRLRSSRPADTSGGSCNLAG